MSPTFSFKPGAPGVRDLLRAHIVADARRQLRQQLGAIVLCSSLPLWLALEWPGLLPRTILTAALVLWPVSSAGYLLATISELWWSRREKRLMSEVEASGPGKEA